MNEIIEGIVSEIIYSNESNGYIVCDIDADGVLITLVGNMPGLVCGENIRVEGKRVCHPEYGEQIKVISYEKVLPSTEGQILLYLSSGIIRGIGPATAVKIVNKFGTKALDVIRDNPKELATVRGISLDKAYKMQRSFLDKQVLQGIIMFLAEYEITANFAIKVYNKFGLSSVSKIKENPYSLCQIHGIGFKSADKIAMKIGIELTDSERLKNGILYVLSQYAANGDSCLPHALLVKNSASILSADELLIENAITTLLFEGKLRQFSGNLYLPHIFLAEQEAARRLCVLASEKHDPLEIEKSAHIFSSASEKITLSDEQISACRTVTSYGASVITGGPGTGKTTIVNAIIYTLLKANKRVALCAPTGRAAKKLSEVCGIEAKTIHRLLEINFSGEDDVQSFARNSLYPLEEDVVLVDEMSMVDIVLMNSLLSALKPGAQIIMIGDADQLPSVGAGNVLSDIVQSKVVPVCFLTHIYRQAAESLIVVNAHKINRGEKPITDDKTKDFFFIKKNSAEEIRNEIMSIYSTRLKKTYGFNPFSDIQIITPSRKTLLGVLELNREIQKVLNPPSKEKSEKIVGAITFREGDKVMQTKNNYDIKWESPGAEGEGVFNGDIGVIQLINFKTAQMHILFDGERLVKYPFDNLGDLEQAYAVTVHKSQGSEFNAVIIPLFSCAPQLLNRNLLYTALTRAKRLAIFVGREDILETMIKNKKHSIRFSSLKERLELIFSA